MLSIPVAFFVFNRPDTTARVIQRIAAAKPKSLFLVADGPRDGHPTDKERCAAVRQIVKRVDWPAEVVANFNEENLGCGRHLCRHDGSRT